MKLPIGVTGQGERYRAQIRVSTKQYHMGVYDDVKSAQTAYKFAKRMAEDVIDRSGRPEIVPKYIEVEKPSWIQRVFGRGEKNGR